MLDVVHLHGGRKIGRKVPSPRSRILGNQSITNRDIQQMFKDEPNVDRRWSFLRPYRPQNIDNNLRRYFCERQRSKNRKKVI